MDGTVVKAALSGRELARQRRQALAQLGRNGAQQVRAAMAHSAPVAAASDAGSGVGSAGCGCGGTGGACGCAGSDGVARMLAAARESASAPDTNQVARAVKIGRAHV